MNGRIKAVFLLVGGLIAVTGLGQEAFACTCAPPESPTDELERSTAVFAGGVTSPEAASALATSSADPVRVTFRVYTSWKGPEHGTLTVTTARSTISCGYPFETGQAYLVYAGGEADDLQVSLCSRTRPLVRAGGDLAVLKKRNQTGTGAKLKAYKYPLTAIAVIVVALGVGVRALLIRQSNA